MATTTIAPAVPPGRDDCSDHRGSGPAPHQHLPSREGGGGPDGGKAATREQRGVAVLGARWPAVAVVAVPMMVLVVSQLRQAGVAGVTVADYGLLELGTAAASRGEQLLGPYSRYGWNHPGPFLFYWNTPFWAATGRQLGGLTLAAAVLNTLTLTGLVAVAGRVGGRVAAWCAAAGVLLLLARYDIERMREAWNPTLTVTTTALTVVLAIAVAAGRRWALPVLALTASTTVQIHLGTLPTVVAVTGAGLVLAAVADRRRLRSWARPAVVAGAVLVALWALPAIEQLCGSGRVADGNVTELVTYFTDGESVGQSAGDSIRAVTKLVAAQDPFLSVYAGPAGGGFPSLPELSTGDVVGVSVLVGALLLGLGVAVAARSRALAAWSALPLIALVAAVVSARQVDDALYLYLVAFTTGTALIAWIAAAVIVVDVAGRARRAVARRRGRDTATAPSAGAATAPPHPVLAALVAVLAGVGVAAAVEPAQTTDPYAERMQSAAAIELRPALLRAIVDADAEVVLLRIASHDMWGIAAPLADTLEDDGIDVRVDPEWTFMFGRHNAADGDEDLVVSLALTTDTDILIGLPVIDEEAGITLALGGEVIAGNATAGGTGPLDDDLPG